MDIFERVQMFFLRLEMYTEVPPTTEMMDTIILMMVEVLSILGVATEEIKQSRMSDSLRVCHSLLNNFQKNSGRS
jgi:hypothetical protein